MGFRATAWYGCNGCNILALAPPYPSWRHYRCVCRCVACNILVSAVVFISARTFFLSYHGACRWQWRSCVACLCSHASSRVDALEREGGGWYSWRFLGRRVRWCGGVVYFVLLVHSWFFRPRGVCGGRFELVDPRHTLFVCLCAYHLLSLCPRACGLCVRRRWCALRWSVAPFSRFRGAALHTITSFRMGCPLGIPSYHSCYVPRCWRPLVLGRCARFLRRWRPIESEKGERGSYLVVGRVGAAVRLRLL